MECNISEDITMLHLNKPEEDSNTSEEGFQKFIYELFDKNGVLNDLRAYLRGHLVEVLKNSRIGTVPMCQRRFADRLKLSCQAMNMLIAEYLLQQEFNYSLSVFVSEIPLANMLFDFSKMLLQDNVKTDNGLLRFNEGDIWSILNYLGIQCDSTRASDIFTMYHKREKPALLPCILTCTAVCQQNSDESNSRSPSPCLTSSDLSLGKDKPPHKSKSPHYKCTHYSYCKVCKNRHKKAKEKCKRIKENSVKKKHNNFIDANEFMKDISALERDLVEEMFEQLKGVYETELEMVREAEREKIQRTRDHHVLELKNKKEQLEQEFKEREAELESSIQEKKKFLWGLAKSLREQHKHMTRAIAAVQDEGKRLTEKEVSLKRQIVEAEDILMQKGDEMRRQISNELLQLETHLQCMKSERDNITKEREQLDHITKHNEPERTDSRYESLDHEFGMLKKYIETTKVESKCVMERSTLTELHDVTSNISIVLNNGHDCFTSNLKGSLEFPETSRSCDVKRSHQVVNDLKKQKNVNFNLDLNTQGSSDLFRERSYSRSSSSADVYGGRELIERLQEENDRLRMFASQQTSHIDELSRHQTLLRSELTARTSIPPPPPPPPLAPPPPPRAPPPPPEPFYLTLQRASSRLASTASNQRKGAGEQLCVLDRGRTRVLVPGDTVPFLGTLGGARHTGGKRHLVSQNRLLKQHTTDENASSTETLKDHLKIATIERQNLESLRSECAAKLSHSVSKDATQRSKFLANDNESFTTIGLIDSEKSPSAVLKEAKMRLKTLEIETKAVEKSYNDFKKKRDDKSMERNTNGHRTTEYNDSVRKTTDTSKLFRINKNMLNESEPFSANSSDVDVKSDFVKYFKNYNTEYDIGKKYFENKTTSLKIVKPIPKSMLETNAISDNVDFKNEDFIDTPLLEFRKYYYSKRENKSQSKIKNKTETVVYEGSDEALLLSPIVEQESKIQTGNAINDNTDLTKTAQEKIEELMTRAEKEKEADLNILRNNLKKLYNVAMDDPDLVKIDKDNEVIKLESQDDAIDEELEDLKGTFTVESHERAEAIEPETKTLESQNNLLVVVESSVEKVDIPDGVNGQNSKSEVQMTIIVSPKSITKELSLIQQSKEVEDLSEKDTNLKLVEDKFEEQEQEQGITRDDVLEAIFNVEASLDQSINEQQSGSSAISLLTYPDSPDHFSPDGDDNFNNSPISQAKTPDDDNFWNA